MPKIWHAAPRAIFSHRAVPVPASTHCALRHCATTTATMDDSSPADRDDEGEHGAPLIQPISQGCVHRLVAGQAVTDLSSAVKVSRDQTFSAWE